MANSVPSREYELIESIRRECGDSSQRWEMGIGDDCAVRKLSNQRMLLTADTMVENVHFRCDLMSFDEIGFKAIAGSVSDIFAMGGSAESMAIQLVFPKSAEVQSQIEALYRGIGDAVSLFSVPVIGGDMASGPCWMIAVTVLGDAGDRVLYRNGARVGDQIWVTGTPGLSGLGLDLLCSRGRTGADVIDSAAVAAHVRPIPHGNLSKWIGENSAITAMIDISDGVGKEVLTIAKESGVGAIVELPHSIRTKLICTEQSVRSPEELFLSGGEDYELLFTASPEFVPSFPGVIFSRIGTITESTESFFVDSSGQKKHLHGGWDHL